VRLLLDECVDARIAGPLRSLGHDVVLVQAIDPSADDRAVLAIATRQERVLVTTDLDFGELLVRTGLRGRGVVLLRLEGAPPEQAAARVGAALAAHGADLPGHLLVVDRHRDRLRRLPPPPLVS
jgi:predicted nuclease of predicted toxin-antitoxin system